MSAPMDPAISVLVKNIIKNEDYAEVKSILNAILTKQTTLLDVVEVLGTDLTNKEVYTRAKATRLLADVLTDLPPDWLTQKEHSVLVQFLCNKVKDHHSTTPHVLKAAHALIKCSRISASDIQLITSAIFNEVHVQSLAQGDRRHVYHLVDYLLTNRLQDMRTLGSDFVFGYIQAMDGEKDPRNLVLAFKCVRVIATNLDIGTFGEDLFEVVACYFPIDFTPPPNDPHGIKKSDLVEGLRHCLSCTQIFAEFCLPLVMEKLSSSLQGAKIDSFLTLAECAATYGEKLVEYSGSLWSAIRREVFAALSESLEQAALTALVAMTTALSKLVTPPGGASVLDSFITDVFQDVSRHLCEPDERLVEPSSKILQYIGSTTTVACCTVISKVIPLLLDQLTHGRQVSDRKVFLKELINFLKLAADFKDNSALLPVKDQLYTTFIGLLSHSSLGHLGLQGIMGLVAIPSMLSSQEVESCSLHFLRVALEQNLELRSLAVSGLYTLCTQLTSTSIDTLWAQLTDSAGDEDLVVEISAGICSCYTLLKHTVPYYIQHLNLLDHNNAMDLAVATESAVRVSGCLHDVISNNIQKPECTEYLYDVVPSRVLAMCVQASVQPPCVLNQWEVVHSLARCVIVIVGKLNTSQGESLLKLAVSVLLEGDTSCLGVTLDHTTHFSHFKPLQLDSPSSQTQLICLFSAIACSQPVTLTFTSPGHMTTILELATRWQHSESSTAAAKCLAGLINKLTDDECPSLDDITSGLSDSPDVKGRTVIVLSWITKALLMKSHSNQRQFVDKLVELLSVPGVSMLAADGFRIILEDTDDILTPEMYAIVRFMFKQRLFVFTVDALIHGFNLSINECRLPYLIALSHLLKFVPHEAMTSHLTTLLPLVVQCLHFDGEDLWLSTLATLNHMMKDSPDLIISYLDDLLTHFLRLSQYKPKMAVRLSALCCLQCVTSLPVSVVVPHQQLVTKTLTSVLDDHKRLVRRDAVITRQKWLLIDAPGT